MPKLNFNQGWRFYRGYLEESAKETDYDDSMWEGVCLPHSVRIEPVMASGMVNYQGDAWYRKHFIIDNEYKDKRIYIRFEAAMHEAKIWVNGKYVMAHYGGYLPFVADVSDYVEFGKTNVIAVKVNNEDNVLIPPGKPQIELDFCYFGGLYRDAYLIVKNNLHITDPIFAHVVGGGGIFVTYSNVSEKSAAVNVKAHIKNCGNKKVKATLKIKLGDITSTEDVTIDCEQTVEKR